MLEKLRKFFSAPVFEDEGVNFNAHNLNVVLLSVFVGITITILRYIALGKFWLGNAGVIFLVTGVVIGGAYILFQKRYFLASSVIAIVVLTLMPFALILMSGNGIHDTAIMILPVVVVITSMLLPWQGLVGYVVFIALAFGVLVRMEVNLNLVTPFSKLTTNSDFTDALTILIVAGLMSGLLVSSLRRNLRRLSEALKEREASEERYRLISNLSSDYIFSGTVHKDGTITHDWQSGAFESISGYTPEEFLAHGGWRSTLHPDDLIIDNQMLSVMRSNQKVMGELRVQTKSGDMRWVRVYAQPVWNENENRLVGIYGAVQDITERKLAEEKLRQSEERYRLISNISTDYVFSSKVQVDGTINEEWTSGAFEVITGYPPEEFHAIGGWRAIVHSSDLSIDDRAREKLRANQTVAHEIRIVKKDGEIRWLKEYIHPVWDDQVNRLTSIYGAVQDITERKQAEERLRQRAEQMSALYDIGLTITSNLDLDQILYDLYEKCRQLLPIDTFYIAVYDEKSQLIRHPLYYEGNQKGFIQVDDRNIETAPGISGHIILSKTTLYLPNFNDPAIQEKFKIVRLGSIQAGSYVGVPILAHDAVIGVISMQKMEPDAYSPEQIRLLETITTQAAIAIENARLYRAEQERRREAETLRESLASVVRALDFSEIIQRILDQIRMVVPYDSASIWRVEGNRQIFIGGRDLPTDIQTSGWEIVIGSGNSDLPIVTGEVPYILSNNVQEELTDFGEPPHNYINSWLSLPLRTRGKLIGVICLDGKQKNQFNNHHADLAVTFADQVAIALENASLYSEIQQELSERKRTEQALRFSEEKFFRAFHTTPVMMTLEDADGRFIEVNNAFLEITGYSRDEVIGHRPPEFNLIPDLEDQIKALKLQNEKGPFESLELGIRRKSGEIGTVLMSIEYIQVNDIRYVLTSALDITERKQAEETLRQRDAILQVVAHAAQVFLQSSDWRESINRVLAELGQATATSHAYIFENHVLEDGTQVTSQRYEWAAPNVLPDIDNPKYQNMPYEEEGVGDWVKILQSGRSYAGNINTLPEKVSAKIQERGLKSILDVPIFVSGKWWGEIGFDDVENIREWSASEIEILEVAARMIGAAIEREKVDEAFRQNEERHRNELENQVVERTSQLTTANLLLQTEKTRIEQAVNEVATLRKLSDFLQSSITIEEASGVVANHMKTLFSNTSGGLYLISDGFADLTLISSWGDFKTESVIQPNDCWGMRRGRVFVRHPSDASPVCAHFGESIPDESLCLPLMGQNEIIGMLCLQISKSDNTYFTQDVQNLAIASADSIALALANLRLRERLHDQSIRDALTGLFNRRFMEETLAREVHRASRNQNPLCVVMFEIDDFKVYNNTFGHEAGNYVLKKVADTMRANLRRSDFPCRYGGDEFTLILPETSLEDGGHRAEELRKAVEALALSFNNQALGQVTVRMGVAAYPKHGETGETVLKVADDASYRARAIGKNCVVVAE